MLEFLRAVGYSIEAAVADLIDNSVQARAKNVVIRLWRDNQQLTRIAIADDGDGIPPSEMRQAMQFAGGGSRGANSLGKFGMGLKLASLSQCTELTVVTRATPKETSGRRWTAEGIIDDWRCDILPGPEAESLVSEDFVVRSVRAD